MHQLRPINLKLRSFAALIPFPRIRRPVEDFCGSNAHFLRVASPEGASTSDGLSQSKHRMCPVPVLVLSTRHVSALPKNLICAGHFIGKKYGETSITLARMYAASHANVASQPMHNRSRHP